jgi:DNA-binding NarL/FixJ family response regulator
MAKSVVIVDDHGGFRAEAKALLTDEGYRVVGEAADGEAAILLVRALDPDIVLLDVQLPDIDGFEVARRLVSESARCRVVLTSGRSAADYGDRVHAAGVPFVTKDRLSAGTLEATLGATG